MDYLEYYKRLEHILELIKTGKAQSPFIISEEMECSEKTVRRMINKLRENGHDILYCRKTKIYHAIKHAKKILTDTK